MDWVQWRFHFEKWEKWMAKLFWVRIYVICFSSEICFLYWNGIHIFIIHFIFIWEWKNRHSNIRMGSPFSKRIPVWVSPFFYCHNYGNEYLKINYATRYCRWYTLKMGILIEDRDLIQNLLRRVFHSQLEIKCLIKMWNPYQWRKYISNHIFSHSEWYCHSGPF